MTVLLELLTVLLEYLDLFNGILQFADFLTVKALVSPQNASIIPDSYTYLLCLKLCRHNRRIPSTCTPNLSTLTTCNFRAVKAIDLKFGQKEALS